MRRFIPAWAGNTQLRAQRGVTPAVHPRVGGEHNVEPIDTRGRYGSSPRGRGTLRHTTGRGGLAQVHPRVGGEHKTGAGVALPIDGSSPRGRGTPTRVKPLQLSGRFIPAWAGNTYYLFSILIPKAVHPRVGGEHCGTIRLIGCSAGSSPRGRGTRPRAALASRIAGFIPAWAGNTCPWPLSHGSRPVHPRVGGEHSSWNLLIPRPDSDVKEPTNFGRPSERACVGF